jgi:uncharacterized protein
MFLDVKELAVRKLRINKTYPTGTIDFHTGEFSQIEPLEVQVVAELVNGEIRVSGHLHTRLDLVCSRCLEQVPEEVARDFDLFYRPLRSIAREEELHLKTDDTEVGFFEGDGLFLADVLAEQVNLAVPMKVICRSDCRGLCPQCGANLNAEECRCDSPNGAAARLAPRTLGTRLRQDWPKKQ